MNTLIVKNQTLEVVTDSQMRKEIFESKFAILPNELSQDILTPYKYTIVTVPNLPTLTPYQTTKLGQPKWLNSKIVIEWVIENKLVDMSLKNEYIEKLRTVFEKHLQQIKNTYPESEVDGWDLQKDEAKNYLINTDYPTPCLDALCIARDVDKFVLVNKILEKANLFAIVYGTIIGTRQKLEDQVLAATTYEELPIIQDSYNFEFKH